MTRWMALSIRQPWVDLILRGIKTVEVREWRVKRRGPFLIHAAWACDWRSVELFGYDSPLSLPRGGLVGYAEIDDVFALDVTRWQDDVGRHLVLHPRRSVFYGVLLADVRPFKKVVRCRGKEGFFPIPVSLQERTRKALQEVGIDPSSTGSEPRWPLGGD